MDRSLLVCIILMVLGVTSVIAAGDRTFTVTNYCSQPLWFHLTGGAVVNPKTHTASCHSNNDCAPGSSCSIPPNLCFW
jgi:hypothetical protein